MSVPKDNVSVAVRSTEPAKRKTIEAVEPVEVSSYVGTPDITWLQYVGDRSASFYQTNKTLLTAVSLEVAAFIVFPFPVGYLHLVVLSGLMAGAATYYYEKWDKNTLQVVSEKELQEAREAARDASEYEFVDLEAALPANPVKKSAFQALREAVGNLSLSDIVKRQVVLPLLSKYVVPHIAPYKNALLVGASTSAAVLVGLIFPYLNIAGLLAVAGVYAGVKLVSAVWNSLDSRQAWEKDYVTVESAREAQPVVAIAQPVQQIAIDEVYFAQPKNNMPAVETMEALEEGYLLVEAPSSRIDSPSIVDGKVRVAAIA